MHACAEPNYNVFLHDL